MVQEALEHTSRATASSVRFGCHSCGSVLSVPDALAGVSGPCPLCGEWIASPGEGGAGASRMYSARSRTAGTGSFVSRRAPVPAVETVPLPPLRPEGRVDWRERRARFERMVAWFQRWQSRLCVAALGVVAATVAYLHSQRWNLPWNLSEDSPVLQVFQGWLQPGSTDLPTGPIRRD
jgi:predicted RNA-binding Zn-ribbon protein involved in translation (DUF1610 family)